MFALCLAISACGARTDLRYHDGGLAVPGVGLVDVYERFMSSDGSTGYQRAGTCMSLGCPASCASCCGVQFELDPLTNCAGRVSGTFNGGFVATIDLSGLSELDL